MLLTIKCIGSKFVWNLNLAAWGFYSSMAYTTALASLSQTSHIDSSLLRCKVVSVADRFEVFEQHGIPAHLRVLFGLEPDRRYVTREVFVAELRVLTEAEKQALIRLLYVTADEVYLQPSELNSLKDSVVKVLKRQAGFAGELAAKLMVSYDDVHTDLVWRDCCIQHLADLYRQDPANSEIQQVLLRASKERSGNLAATALLAIRKNVSSGFTQEVLLQRAFALAADATYSDTVRLTALQVCAELGDIRVLPLAREINRSQSSIHLRMSAIAVLGRLGEVHDHELIKQYVLSSDTRLRTAAKAALELLNQRFATVE